VFSALENHSPASAYQIKSVEVGTHATWSKLSDHVPLCLDVTVPAFQATQALSIRFLTGLDVSLCSERTSGSLHSLQHRDGAIAAEICLSMHSPVGFLSGECMDK
jgi:hypothetical protein